MSSLTDMTFKRQSDSIKGSEFDGVKPILAPAAIGSAMLSEQLIERTTPQLFGLRVSESKNILYVSGGIVHNTWFNERTVRIGSSGIRVWLVGEVIYPTGSFIDSGGVEQVYRQPGPKSVELDLAVKSVGDDDATPSAFSESKEPIFLFLGEVRKPANAGERAASVNGWYLDAAAPDQFATPQTHISVLAFRISDWFA